VLRDGEAPTQRSEEDVLRDGEPPARRQSFLANAGAVLWGASSGAGGCASELHWHHLHHKKRLVFLAIAKTSTRHTHQLLSTTAGKQNFSFYHLRPRAVLDGGYEPPAPCADAACAARGANATLALSLRGYFSPPGRGAAAAVTWTFRGDWSSQLRSAETRPRPRRGNGPSGRLPPQVLDRHALDRIGCRDAHVLSRLVRAAAPRGSELF